jgi:hypothetical protein
VEVIQRFGLDVNYIPRTLNNYDELLGEDAISTYASYHEIEMYIKSWDGFSGDGQFFSMHGFEVRDELILTCSITQFARLVDADSRPKEGDIIHFPFNNAIFVIKFVNVKPNFFPHAQTQAYELVCEMFEYSGERFSTGIEVVDALQNSLSTDVVANPGMDLDETPNDFMSDNEFIGTEADDILFDENNPFGDA